MEIVCFQNNTSDFSGIDLTSNVTSANIQDGRILPGLPIHLSPSQSRNFQKFSLNAID
jgi:hypothetical protein